MKYRHYGDPELLEEYPGEVEKEAERLCDRYGSDFWWGISEGQKSLWRKAARAEIVKRRPGEPPVDVPG